MNLSVVDFSEQTDFNVKIWTFDNLKDILFENQTRKQINNLENEPKFFKFAVFSSRAVEVWG